MGLIDRIPGFRVLKDIETEPKAQSTRALAVTLIFTFFPQIIAAYILLISSKKSASMGALAYDQLFAHGDLLLYSLALVAPTYTLVWRDAALTDRFWLALYSFGITIFSSVTFEMILVNHQIEGVALVVVSSIAILLTMVLLYVTDIIEQVDPGTVARKIERTNEQRVTEMQSKLRG